MKKSVIPILFALSLFAFLGAVSAAPTLVTPASSATVSGASVVWNASNGTIIGVTSCSLWVKSVSTANSTYVNVSTAANASANALYINGTFDSSTFEDSNDYSMLVTCSNSTAGSASNSTANTGITIDNTVPQAPTSLTPSSYTVNSSTGTYTFSSTVVNANTTSCTYTIGRGGTSSSSLDTTTAAATYSGSTCSFTKTFSSSSNNGDWYWFITASDGTNTTNSVTNILDVRIAGSNGGLTPQQVTEAQKKAKQLSSGGGFTGSLSSALLVIAIIAIVAIVATVIYFRRKRR